MNTNLPGEWLIDYTICSFSDNFVQKIVSFRLCGILKTFLIWWIDQKFNLLSRRCLIEPSQRTVIFNLEINLFETRKLHRKFEKYNSGRCPTRRGCFHEDFNHVVLVLILVAATVGIVVFKRIMDAAKLKKPHIEW